MTSTACPITDCQIKAVTCVYLKCRKAGGLSLTITQQANLQRNFALELVHSSFCQRGRKSLKGHHTKQRESARSSTSISCAQFVCSPQCLCIECNQISLSVLFATIPEAGETPKKPKVWFHHYCQPCLYISALTCNFSSFGLSLAQIQTNTLWKCAGRHTYFYF